MRACIISLIRHLIKAPKSSDSSGTKPRRALFNKSSPSFLSSRILRFISLTKRDVYLNTVCPYTVTYFSPVSRWPLRQQPPLIRREETSTADSSFVITLYPEFVSSLVHVHAIRVFVRKSAVSFDKNPTRDTDLGSNVFADTCELRSSWAGRAAPNCRCIQDTISAGNSQRNRCGNMIIFDLLKTKKVPVIEGEPMYHELLPFMDSPVSVFGDVKVNTRMSGGVILTPLRPFCCRHFRFFWFRKKISRDF